MGRRSGVVDNEESLSAFSLEELDEEIARCKQRLDLANSRVLERAFEIRTHKLERIRKRVAGPGI
jgi:ribosomal protein L29